MDYVLTGSRQVACMRVFAFDAVAADRQRTACTVSIDTGLIRKYSIALQELPLMCRQLLERGSAVQRSQTLTFTEADMAGVASERAEILRAAQQRKFNRKIARPIPPA